MKIVLGISGATGAIYGIRILEILHFLEVETHLVLSEAAKKTICLETRYHVAAVEKMASWHGAVAAASR